MDKNKFKEVLFEKAKEIDVNIEEKKLEKFYEYKELVIEWNEKINLTAITEDEEFIIKHLVDSLTINKYIDKNKKIIDIGTGAGFPGVPLKIMNDDVNVVLFDSLNKRLNVLNDIIEKIDLKEVETLHGRAEETFKNKKYREKFDIATSRAVANLNVLSELMLPAIKVGGICICMKGKCIDEEINDAKKAIDILGGKIKKIEKLTLPNTDYERNIIIIKKVRNTPSQYPRKPGTPQKQPIL